ncbi:hypothetical protein T05_7042 [Trichinella murrelli]|uniref:Uncharacterized protein n=1 Tax=Trichinella murrelli TaxID=144512 RepID=A0A0V0TG17_9BILA|nr:hypothetical protein T05_7042 [Trichinella murrelli]
MRIEWKLEMLNLNFYRKLSSCESDKQKGIFEKISFSGKYLSYFCCCCCCFLSVYYHIILSHNIAFLPTCSYILCSINYSNKRCISWIRS